ncbi:MULTISPECIES: ABC transporter permease subunit [Glycomyces]|uniref:ABC transporter permease n=1 Tax=Glycomyces lechevalierae TaxID=256034 RepID=A0A9X3SVK3_9ACTN|nr:ABC transporter permease [Glycomyces lechevalierae]MDA1386084.1 ABC transporter permease [Glycomyces lechevalierae]MDR7340758.1 ABC-type dipeptide/oligopeptide/nickel transport system permease component [Glycomyces lechevalierae]
MNRWEVSSLLPQRVLGVGSARCPPYRIRGTHAECLRTRGVSTKAIVYKHALRNAAAPELVVLSLEFIGMFGGALIIENMFALPGFGSFAFNSSIQGDIPVIMGITVFSVMLVVGVNLVTDLINGWLNPKARIF